MGYRCWRLDCSKEIPGGQEVWRDWYGNIVDWHGQLTPADPAPYHPECMREPEGGEPPGQIEVVDTSSRLVDAPSPRKLVPVKKDAFDIGNLPKPKQLSMFEEEK